MDENMKIGMKNGMYSSKGGSGLSLRKSTNY